MPREGGTVKRWHAELDMMLKRWKVEREKHRRDGNVNCRCLRGPGTMRKGRLWGYLRPRCKLCHPRKSFSRRIAARTESSKRSDGTKEADPVVTCSQCGSEFKPGMKGWCARVEGLGSGGRSEAPLKRILLCPDDFKKLPASQRMAWHEYAGDTQGATREKRPGHLGEAV